MIADWLPDALFGLGSSLSARSSGLLVVAAWTKGPLFGAVGWLVWRLRAKPLWTQICGVALAFGAGEWGLERWSLGVPYALLGHSQISALGVAQLAVVGGVPLISSCLVALNQSLTLVLTGLRGPRRLAAALLAAWVAAALFGLPVAKLVRPAPARGEGVRLLLVQPDLPHHDRWEPDSQLQNLDRVATYTDAAFRATAADVSAVVWPENLLTTPIDEFPALSNALQAWVDRWQVSVITGLVRSSAGASPRLYRNSVAWIDPGRGLTNAIDKTRAIPVLESSRVFPGASFVKRFFGRAARWPKVQEASSAGPLRGTFALTAVLCYEALFPRLVAARRSVDSVAILNVSDDSWASSEAASRQLLAFASFRAIEQRLTLVRVAHGGLSAIVSPFGEIAKLLPPGEHAAVTAPLRPMPAVTLIERLAILTLACLVGASAFWFASRKGRGIIPVALRQRVETIAGIGSNSSITRRQSI